ncbi:MAG TPA: hypothetical protein VG733_02080 [Chthoniobacteraceae bacterium]|nr:hypothetical protein [Chthoniobacteraceae bacterium]
MPDSEIIAVTFALPEESKDFLAKLQRVREESGGELPVVRGEFEGRQIVVCHTGVGMDSCRARIDAFLGAQQPKPRALISSGFAGALNPGLKVGDVLVAANYSSTAMLAKVSLKQATQETMTTQPRVAETAGEKTALFAQTGASAVDMETSVIFEHCSRAGIPMLSLRGISDEAGEDLPVSFPIWFDEVKQRPRVGALLRELAVRPAKIPRFARFVRGISLARARLTGALCVTLQQV